MLFLPLASAIGGAFIGVGSGVFMLGASRIAGVSGLLKMWIEGPVELTRVAFLCGLCAAGVLMFFWLPAAFESPPEPSFSLLLGALAVGAGTALGNGCTSGHGLCGLSRISKRSMVAVPVFMGSAIATATIRSGGVIGSIAPIGVTPASTLVLAGWIAGALALGLLPLLVGATREASWWQRTRETYTGFWCGLSFGVGLSIGGMIRPSAVLGALSPTHLDLTLWVLFVTALGITFGLYRAAEVAGVGAARAVPALPAAPNPDQEPATLPAKLKAAGQATIATSRLQRLLTPGGAAVDAPLVLGALLFGVGWGTTGVCPGPLVVVTAAAAATLSLPPSGLLLLLLGVFGGMLIGRPAARAIDQML